MKILSLSFKIQPDTFKSSDALFSEGFNLIALFHFGHFGVPEHRKCINYYLKDVLVSSDQLFENSQPRSHARIKQKVPKMPQSILQMYNFSFPELWSQGNSWASGLMQQVRPTFKEKVAAFRNENKWDRGQDKDYFENNFNGTKSSKVAGVKCPSRT